MSIFKLTVCALGLFLFAPAFGANLPAKPKEEPPKSEPSPAPSPKENIQVFQLNAPTGLTYSPEAILRVRDPFKSPDIVIEVVKKGELEMYSLDSLKFVAITTGPDRVSALVLSPDAKTYFVRERMKIGLNGGVVRKITPEALVIHETSLNVLGEREIVETLIELQAQSKFQKAENNVVQQGGQAKNAPPPGNDAILEALGGVTATPSGVPTAAGNK